MNMLLTVLYNALYLTKYGVLADCSCAGEGCSCLISTDAGNDPSVASNLFGLKSSAKSSSGQDANNTSELCWGSSKNETGEAAESEKAKKTGEGAEKTSKLSSSSSSENGNNGASELFGFGESKEKQGNKGKNTKAELFGFGESKEKKDNKGKNTKSKLLGGSKSKKSNSKTSKLFGSDEDKNQKGTKGKSSLFGSSKSKKSKLVGDAAQSNLCAADAENDVQAYASPELSSNLVGSEGAQGEASCLVGGPENNSGLIYTDDPGHASHLAGERGASQEGLMN